MSKRGMFRVDRGVFSHPAFKDEPFSEREAWLWLVSEAAYKPHQQIVAGITVTLKRGQLACSLRFMATRWSWTEARVRRFLGRLKSDARTDALIDAQTDAGITVISICKYEAFQLPAAHTDPRIDAPKDKQTTQIRNKGNILSKDRSAEAPAIIDDAEDPRAALFRAGFSLLRGLTGKPDPQCRSLIGRWLKKANDDARRVLRTIEDARDNQVADPVPWIEAALKTRGAPDVGSYSFVFGRH